MDVNGPARIPTGKDRYELDVAIHITQLAPSQERSPDRAFGGLIRIGPVRVAVPDVHRGPRHRWAVIRCVHHAQSEEERYTLLRPAIFRISSDVGTQQPLVDEVGPLIGARS